MAKAIWTGSIQFGMVNIPVKLNSAVKERDVHFRQINSKTGNQVKQKRVDAVTGTDVDYGDIVKGYEISPGKHVIIKPEELDALDPDASKTIEIDTFVDPSELDPVMFDHPYYLVPDNADQPYVLLREALKKTGKAAIGTYVMREKQYVTCVWPHGEALAMTTLHWHDEVLEPATDLKNVSVDDRQIDMAAKLIESLSEDFDPSKYTDEHRAKVLDLIQQKADGKVIQAAAPAPAPKPMNDLLSALEASLAVIDKKHQAKRDSQVAQTA